jgi:hypothetical protein
MLFGMICRFTGRPILKRTGTVADFAGLSARESHHERRDVWNMNARRNKVTSLGKNVAMDTSRVDMVHRPLLVAWAIKAG